MQKCCGSNRMITFKSSLMWFETARGLKRGCGSSWHELLRDGNLIFILIILITWAWVVGSIYPPYPLPLCSHKGIPILYLLFTHL